MPTTIPTDAAGLEEILSDPAKRKDVTSDPKAFGEFVKAYANTMQPANGDLSDQIRDQIKASVTEMFQANGKDVSKTLNFTTPDKTKAAGISVYNGHGTAYNARAQGRHMDDVFADIADVGQAVFPRWNSLPNRKDIEARLTKAHDIQNAYSEAVPSDGGLLVPESVRSEIMTNALETAVVRPLARVIPMDTLRVGIPTVDETTHVGSVFGGVVCYWTEEAAALTASQAKFGKIVLDANKLTAYAVASNELIKDAPAFGTYLANAFPEAMVFEEDYKFLTGTGVGEPLGALSAPAMVTVTEEATQSANTVVWENIVKMYARMLPSSLGRAVWVVSPAVFPELATMALSVGTGGSAIWLNNGAAGPPMTILGRPVIVTEKVPTLGTVGDVNFIDFSHYLIGDRQRMEMATSEHANFATDQTAFRLISRVDGRPALNSAITPVNGGDTLSPFVQMGART